MHNPSPMTISGVIFGILSFLAGISWSQWAQGAGLAGVVLSVFFQIRRDRREARKEARDELEFEYKVGKKQDRRELDCSLCNEERRATDLCNQETK